MAKTVYSITQVDIAGRVVDLRPVSIGVQRKMMNSFREFQEWFTGEVAKGDDSKVTQTDFDLRQLDAEVEMNVLALSWLDKKHEYDVEFIEDNIDEGTLKYVIKKAIGLDLGNDDDPKAEPTTTD